MEQQRRDGSKEAGTSCGTPAGRLRTWDCKQNKKEGVDEHRQASMSNHSPYHFLLFNLKIKSDYVPTHHSNTSMQKEFSSIKKKKSRRLKEKNSSQHPKNICASAGLSAA